MAAPASKPASRAAVSVSPVEAAVASKILTTLEPRAPRVLHRTCPGRWTRRSCPCRLAGPASGTRTLRPDTLCTISFMSPAAQMRGSEVRRCSSTEKPAGLADGEAGLSREGELGPHADGHQDQVRGQDAVSSESCTSRSLREDRLEPDAGQHAARRGTPRRLRDQAAELRVHDRHDPRQQLHHGRGDAALRRRPPPSPGR